MAKKSTTISDNHNDEIEIELDPDELAAEDPAPQAPIGQRRRPVGGAAAATGAPGTSAPATPASTQEALLRERGKTHGDFADHARCTQRLKDVFRNELKLRRGRGQCDLDPTHIEAIEMHLHKIGRIVAGDPDFADHWDDISGYAEIAKRKGGVK